jgi:ubiquinol-cytochrome c reductase cytochrome b subunit
MVACEHFEPDFDDKASLQRGAKYFVNYCMGCHSANFSRFSRVAEDLEIPEKLVAENLIFGDQKIGETMGIAMAPKKSKAWFGATPPDLSLETRARTSEWVYTYLLSFYKDDTRPTGVNNKVFPNVGMPHVLLELQGLPECATGPHRDIHGRTERDKLGEPKMVECGKLEVGKVKGTMTPAEYTEAVGDLVNFMTYLAEPGAARRESMGWYVLGFLSVFFICVLLLNREYWKDVH